MAAQAINLQTTNKELKYCEIMSALKTASMWAVFGASFYMSYYVGMQFLVSLFASASLHI